MKILPAFALIFSLASCAMMPENPFLQKTAVEQQDYQRSLKIAQIAKESNNPGAAIDIYTALLKKHPEDEVVLFALAQTYLQVGMPREAARILLDLEKAGTEDVDILVGLGRANLLLYRPGIAESYFERALHADPDNKAAKSGTAVSKDILGHHLEARVLFRQLLADNPDDLETKNNMALSHLLEGNYLQAVNLLKEIAFGQDGSIKMRQNLALAYGLLGNRREAERIGLMDLDAASVKNNLQYYELLRLSGDPANVRQLLLGPRSETFLPGKN